jgi:hypothetical protein
VGGIPPRPSGNIGTPPPARLEQNAESKVFFSLLEEKLVARIKRIVKKILLEA